MIWHDGSNSDVGRTVAWACLIVLMLVTLFPFYWMLRTALSDNTQLPGHPNSLLPVETTLGAFKRVLGLSTIEEAQAQGGSGAAVNFWLYLRNSLIVATVTTVCQVFFSAMAAYAFARLRWPGRDKVFALFLAALMVPPIFTTLPNFVLIKNLGLLNSFAGIILPGAFMTPFAIFFLRQFFLGINRELEEAAMIDGAGHRRIFFGLIIPMSGGADRHAGDPDLHQLLERLLLAAAGRPAGERPRADGRPRRVPVADPAGRAGLGRADGRDADRGAADDHPVPARSPRRITNSIGFSGIK